jgi:hypothetical protein
MYKISVVVIVGLIGLLISNSVQRSAIAQENNQAPDGFTALFNGQDLSGWHGLAHFDPRKLAEMTAEEVASKRAADMEDVQQHWTVENGELVNDGFGVYLTTDEEFTDYELWIDYKTVPLADSGIYLKGNPQVQIWDSTEEKKFGIGADKGSGGLWNNNAGSPGKDPAVKADKPFGEWNRFRIIQVGATTSVWLNGKQVVDHAIMENFWTKNEDPTLKFNRAKPLFPKGFIQLQTHGGEIRWRNIFVKRYSSAEANAYLREQGMGFQSIFNGKDLSGWKGAVENYQVEDGAIVCKPGKGGNLYHEEELTDFVVRLEFKLPPGGNNGLAIRYPGTGDAAYGAMCELQVLDGDDKKYGGNLDLRQHHGSAYGMAAAHRGFMRPPGEWNFQEVIVQGSEIKVLLNGNLILDTDLSVVDEFMANSPHPGKDLKSGYFGFAGHSDPVAFRNVEIKSLK